MAKKASKKDIQLNEVTTASASDFPAIIRAHHVTKQALCLWGSSGYGKTSTVRAAAKELGFDIVDMRLSYRDPLSLFLPVVTEGVIEYIFSDILNVMFHAKKPTIVFLDEITNPSSPEIYNVLKELLNERTILGKPVSDNVVFVAASNWAEEDTGVKELPDSLMKRMTHIAFAPDKISMTQRMQPHAAKFFSGGTASNLLNNGHIEDFKLTPCPRQIDACEQLAVVGGLRGAALRQVFIGRIGPEAGVVFATYIEEALSGSDNKPLSEAASLLATLPPTMTKADVPTLVKLEEMGHVSEILGYILAEGQDQAAVAKYLGLHAGAEIVRAVFEREKYNGYFVDLDDLLAAVEDYAAKHPEVPREELADYKQPVPWALPAYTRGVLQIGSLP